MHQSLAVLKDNDQCCVENLRFKDKDSRRTTSSCDPRTRTGKLILEVRTRTFLEDNNTSVCIIILHLLTTLSFYLLMFVWNETKTGKRMFELCEFDSCNLYTFKWLTLYRVQPSHSDMQASIFCASPKPFYYKESCEGRTT